MQAAPHKQMEWAGESVSWGYITHGEWAPVIREAIAQHAVSISPLELLSCALILHVGHEAGFLPEERRVVIRNDNLNATQVINTGKAYSGQMLQALHIFRKVQTRLAPSTLKRKETLLLIISVVTVWRRAPRKP